MTPVSSPGRAGGRSWAELLADAGRGRPSGAATRGPGRRTRVPDEDIVLVGRKRGDLLKKPHVDASPGESAAKRGPAFRVRTTLMLGIAAYYMALGIYQGVAHHKPHAIQVNPTFTSGTVIT